MGFLIRQFPEQWLEGIVPIHKIFLTQQENKKWQRGCEKLKGCPSRND